MDADELPALRKDYADHRPTLGLGEVDPPPLSCFFTDRCRVGPILDLSSKKPHGCCNISGARRASSIRATSLYLIRSLATIIPP